MVRSAEQSWLLDSNCHLDYGLLYARDRRILPLDKDQLLELRTKLVESNLILQFAFLIFLNLRQVYPQKCLYILVQFANVRLSILS